MIKPGSVCYLVQLVGSDAIYNGRIATVVAPGKLEAWEIRAPWIDDELRKRDCCGLDVAARHLLPINDPDEPLTTHTPEEMTA